MRVREVIETCLNLMRHSEWDQALEVLNDVLSAKLNDPWVLFLMGTCHQNKGNDGLAYALLLAAMQQKPDFFEAMVNITPILREMGDHEKEISVWNLAKELRPNDPDVLHNIAGAYINNGTPEKAEELARLSIEQEGNRPDNLIQLSLALLEQEKFGEGFDTWDEALKTGERKHRNFNALGQTPTWDGTPGLNVMVYGEQGHGDELLFSSCMKEVKDRCEQVYIDTSKKDLVSIYERSFPYALVSCTPDSQMTEYHATLLVDAMIPFGSLPTLFRRSVEDFPAHDGYIKAHPAKKREMRKRLDELGDGLKIGLAWKGGVRKTHSCHRTIDLTKFSPILSQNAHFVSVQYTESAGLEAEIQQDETGVPIHHWQPVIDDFDMLTALIDELDLVITVPQTAVHQRAALGKECWVLTPYKAPWTFGRDRDHCVWYPKQTRMFRQKKSEGMNWTPAILRCAEALSERTGSKPGAVIIPPEQIPGVLDLNGLAL